MAVRRDAARAALDAVAPDARLVLLGHPDGGIRERREAVRDDLAVLLADAAPGTWVAAPWRGDGHRDHRVTGEVVAELVGALPAARGIRLVEYPVWMWHWATPDDPRVPWAAMRALPLDARTREAKRAAIRAHASQGDPLSDAPEDAAVLQPGFLRHADRDREVLIVSDDATATPTDAERFDPAYAPAEDPWRVQTRWYERRKRLATLAALPDARYGRALEIGCSIGVTTAGLAERVDELLAVDVAPTAVERARVRLADAPHVRLEVRDVGADWPAGAFDLVVMSEVGYCLDDAAFDRVLAALPGALGAGGPLVACHWRHPEGDFRRTGDEVHARLAAVRGLHVMMRHEEDDFLLEVQSSAEPRSGRRAHGAAVTGTAAAAAEVEPAPRIRAVTVVIPARDEEELVGRCLASVEVAAARARADGVRVRVILVADDCRDRTAEVARAAGVEVIESAAGRVGAARAQWGDAARAGWDGDDAEHWIACTDADSAVPPAWITSQLELADGGADVVVGTVRPELDDLSPAQGAAWRATRVPGHANGHGHGANLGVRADAYVAAGGFPAVAEHEDVDLVTRLRGLDARITASAAGEVLTSSRREGRTPGGYAGYLHVSLLERAREREIGRQRAVGRDSPCVPPGGPDGRPRSAPRRAVARHPAGPRRGPLRDRPHDGGSRAQLLGGEPVERPVDLGLRAPQHVHHARPGRGGRPQRDHPPVGALAAPPDVPAALEPVDERGRGPRRQVEALRQAGRRQRPAGGLRPDDLGQRRRVRRRQPDGHGQLPHRLVERGRVVPELLEHLGAISGDGDGVGHVVFLRVDRIASL